MEDDIIRLYFSFRSPYSCLGVYRFTHILNELELNYRLIPLAPTKEFVSQPMHSPDKLHYIGQDISRMFSAYGLTLTMPEPFDIDWSIPHAAFICADKYKQGLGFANKSYLARFSAGKNIADEQVLFEIADELELDRQELAFAYKKRIYQRELLRGRKLMKQDNVFGVPTFVYQGNLFWGNDRIEWLLRAIRQNRGYSVPDLSIDHMSRPY